MYVNVNKNKYKTFFIKKCFVLHTDHANAQLNYFCI